MRLVIGSCSGSFKYLVLHGDRRIHRILGGLNPHPDLLVAAYSSSTWQKIDTAQNILENFALHTGVTITWPVNLTTITGFIDWAIIHKNLVPSSVRSYLSHIKLIHKLRGIDASACENFLCKTQIKGATNLQFYKPNSRVAKKIMTLPLLKVLGHSIAICDWSDHSKCVFGLPPVWHFLAVSDLENCCPKRKTFIMH